MRIFASLKPANTEIAALPLLANVMSGFLRQYVAWYFLNATYY